MKKLLVVLALGAFTACNSGTSENATDSTAVAIDSAADVTTDSISASADSTINKVDSAADAKVDSLKN